MKINIRQVKTRVPSYDLAAAPTTGMIRLVDKSAPTFTKCEEEKKVETMTDALTKSKGTGLNTLSKKHHRDAPLTIYNINSLTGLQKASKHLRARSLPRNDSTLPQPALPHMPAPTLADAEDASSFDQYCDRIRQSHEQVETRHHSGRASSPPKESQRGKDD